LKMGVPGATSAYEQLSNVLFDMYDEYEEFRDLKAAVRAPPDLAEAAHYHEMREEDLAGSADCSRRSPVPMISLDGKFSRSRCSDDAAVPTTARVEAGMPSSADADLSRKVTDTCGEWVSGRREASLDFEDRQSSPVHLNSLKEHLKSHNDSFTDDNAMDDDDERFFQEEDGPDIDTATVSLNMDTFGARLSQGTFVGDRTGLQDKRQSEVDEMDEEDSREINSQFRNDCGWDEDNVQEDEDSLQNSFEDRQTKEYINKESDDIDEDLDMYDS